MRISDWSSDVCSSDLFSGVVISGAEGMKKPDRRIYDLLIGRFALTPARTLFIDDRADNAQAARDAGWQAIVFTSAEELAAELRARRLLPPADRKSVV